MGAPGIPLFKDRASGRCSFQGTCRVRSPLVDTPAGGEAVVTAFLFLLFIFSVCLVAGGMVFMLAAEWRGLRNIDPRWDVVARRFSGIALFLGAVVVGLLGVGLGIIQILFYPRQTEHLLTIFSPPLIGGWASYIAGMVFLAVYHFGWSRWRRLRKWHAAFGISAVLCVWAAASVLVSLQSFTLTTGAWPGSGALRSALLQSVGGPFLFLLGRGFHSPRRARPGWSMAPPRKILPGGPPS